MSRIRWHLWVIGIYIFMNLVLSVNAIAIDKISDRSINMGYVPRELQGEARNIDQLYRGNIRIVIDHSIDGPGDFVPRHLVQTGNMTVYGPAVIRINPDKFKEWKTDFGGVLAHEFSHAKDWMNNPQRYNNDRAREAMGVWTEISYRSHITTKISGNPRTFMSTDRGLWTGGLRDPIYNVSQKIHLSQVPRVDSLGLPKNYFSDTKALQAQQGLFQQSRMGMNSSEYKMNYNMLTNRFTSPQFQLQTQQRNLFNNTYMNQMRTPSYNTNTTTPRWR